jgi:hypothetical protein
MTGRLVGIDLNGLIDQTCLYDGFEERFSLGEVPSIVVLPENQSPRARRIDLASGLEASRSFDGRGWSWPEAARKQGSPRRLSIDRLLAAMVEDRPIKIGGAVYQAADMVAAAIQGAGARPGANERSIVTVRDNGTFTDEVQQRLIHALRARGLNVTLLWRSVAALLGLEDDLNPIASKLHGKQLGIVSLLADGIDVSVLCLESHRDDAGSYLVPVRQRQGAFVPYTASIFECAEEYALSLAGGDPDVAHQLMWGGGAAIGAYLMGRGGATLVQDHGKWRLFDISGMKQNAPLPSLDFRAIEATKVLLAGIEFVVFEGPASDARSTDFRMAYELRDLLIADGVNVLKYGWIRENEGLAAKGAVRYVRRTAAARKTYYDYLPGIRFAAMTDDGPAFIDLVPPSERLEGGQAYGPKTFDLKLWLEPATTKLTNYLVKELSPEPRVSQIELRSRPTRRIPIKVEIYQKPLAGLARISLISDVTDEFSPIELDWGRMEIEGRTEAEILESILPRSSAVPPISPTLCHPALWTEGSDKFPPLVRLLSEAGMFETYLPSSDQFAELVSAVYSRLYRADTLYRITYGTNQDRTPYRAISSLGEVPSPTGQLTKGDIDRLDEFLATLARLIVRADLPLPLRGKWATTCSWAYSRCPAPVTILLGGGILSDDHIVFKPQTAYQCLGRVVSQERDAAKLFNAVAKVRDHKIYHIRAVTSVLSRLEGAGRVITIPFAEHMTKIAIENINYNYKINPSSSFLPASIQLIAALLRGRLANPDLLDPEVSEAGKLAVEAMWDLVGSKYSTERNIKLATSVVEWLQKRGTDSGVLSQESDDGNDFEDGM